MIFPSSDDMQRRIVEDLSSGSFDVEKRARFKGRGTHVDQGLKIGRKE